MSQADTIFRNTCLDIINNGIDTTGESVRATWADTNEPAYTIKKFGVVNRYNLQKEFPAITLRPTSIKAAADELLWIWQKKSNNVNDLNSHIWDSWADAEGSIGKAYGYQIGKTYAHHYLKDYPTDEVFAELKEYPSSRVVFKDDNYWVLLDQIDGVIWDLKHNPFSRRIMTNIYNFEDLHDMNLYPCAYSMTFNVTRDKEDGRLTLNGILNQRSQDMLTAGNWNVVQYAILIMMLAKVCDMYPGELVHVIADCHIYDRHIPVVKELIERPTFDAPSVWLDKVDNFYDFKIDNIHIDNYQHNSQIKFPVAI